MTGDGRLARTTKIADEVARILQNNKDIAGETVLITAGGTREPIDPVRYIGNRSSGKMGHALAEAAAARGARVILVTAATIVPSVQCEIVRVNTTEEMRAAVLAALPRATIVIKAAAVSDYRVRDVAAQKLKRVNAINLELEPTEDILLEVTRRRDAGTLVIAFAAETERLLEEAHRKLALKGVDAIVANDVSREGFGFDSDRNSGVFITSSDEILLPESSKRVMADRILDHITQLRTLTPFAKEHEVEPVRC
jgi:phosphopantothenoylcysteine decarboxylase/phosphopantothenate--cysteine ligase